MAYGYTDIDLELARQKDGDIKLLTDLDAIKANILNTVRTTMGSRRMQPDYFYGPINYLFEPISESSADGLGAQLLDLITTWEDRIEIENLHVEGNMRSATYNITLTYKLKALGSPAAVYSLSFILKKL